MNEFDRNTTEIRVFLEKLTERGWAFHQLSQMWDIIYEFSIEMIILGKKWKGLSKQKGMLPIGKMRNDLKRIFIKYNCEIGKDEDAIEYGIRSTSQFLDELTYELPYLNDTNFANYISEISHLLREVYSVKPQNEILKLLREVREHSDMMVIGQFCLNEMVEYYIYISESRLSNDRQEMVKYLDFYQKLYEIYIRDILITFCLLKLRDTGNRPAYAEIRREVRGQRRDLQDKIRFVRSQIKLFGKPYNRKVRDAISHFDFETNSTNQVVTFYTPKNKLLTYEEIRSLTKEMSAIVLAFRLLIVILSNNNWKDLQTILQ